MIHCLAIPIFLALGITGLSLAFFEQEWVHWLLIVPIVLLLLTSLPSGFSRHLNKIPLVLGMTGGVLILFSLVAPEAYEKWVVVIASSLIIAAHFYNWKLLSAYRK